MPFFIPPATHETSRSFASLLGHRRQKTVLPIAADSRSGWKIFRAPCKMKTRAPWSKQKEKSAVNGIKIESLFLSTVVFLSSSHASWVFFFHLLFHVLGKETLKFKIISMNLTIHLYMAQCYFKCKWERLEPVCRNPGITQFLFHSYMHMCFVFPRK